ncbi:transposase IS3/IS911 family protein [Clostridium pasteurianum DSM 525 = ATCC 6013]|uniref:Transposase IS3/IS911 family protein n=1 Tax=Clostridium pasteurianum DSM 525 = ATCC 6013 TaxID=1262449 RepID=A0A0H3JB90_CLOPA|nr:transposase IS3/IS911 family protein [Clostridium pasteurianum DSM 525 = ATCC 6013]AOZ80290.1 hypothetical protein AQ984_15775 [Clostridium pasteurianum]AJA53303.1 transposase IS3/IS911 family protein [Clostridium pasteurianum DSM 525 = ATCC 6013]AOZ76493.1 hypothetical protein AQ983_15780 [Clostridium pasteurianum DSM 525 = ATCC 6013]ELP58336.1 transposase IS3/IS911 family protein [Clostridium pasteurianum DSM 525 = ATCC 6013]
MGRTVKSYTEEYKNTIVELFNNGKTYKELNSEYGVPKSTIRQWVNKVEKRNDGTEEKENNIKEILKRDALLQEENEILKKALSIFAKAK